MEYYRINGQALTYGEYWRLSPNALVFAYVALRKLLRVPMRFTATVPRPDALYLLEPSQISEGIRRRWQPAVEECQDRGLRLQFCNTLPLLERERATYGASLLRTDGLVGAAIVTSIVPSKEKTVFACLSRLANGRLLVTNDQWKKLETPPEYEHVRLPGASPEVVLDRHLEEIQREGRRLLQSDEATWRELVLHWSQRNFDFNLVRGVYVPMTEEEIEEIKEKQRHHERVVEW
jgi:hypothetical protein